MLFHSNNSCKNEPQYYVIRTLPLFCIFRHSVFCVFKIVRVRWIIYLWEEMPASVSICNEWEISKNYKTSSKRMPPLNVTIIRLIAPSYQLTRLCRDNGTTTRKIWVMKSQKSSRIKADILNKYSELCMKSARKIVKYHHGIWTGYLTKISKFCLRCCVLFWNISLHCYRTLLIHGQ